MDKAETLKHLRKLTSTPAALQKAFWKVPKDSPFIAKGSVVELIGNAKTEWLLEFFNLHPESFVFWCEQQTAVNPTAIHQRQVSLHRIKFINSSEDHQPLIRLALESGQYPFVIAPNGFEEVRTFQRFQLLAEKSKSTLFLLAKEKFSAAWPISLQMEINFSDTSLKIRVFKQKHGIDG